MTDGSVEKENEETESSTVTDEGEEMDSTIEENISEEPLEDDPFANWDDIFEPFDREKAEGLTGKQKEEVRRIVREEIKKWVKGVKAGKYPFPVGMYPYPAGKYPYPTGKKEIDEEVSKGMEAKINQLKETFEKELKRLQDEVDKIRDQPAEIIEKSLDDKQENKDRKQVLPECYTPLEDGGLMIKFE